MSAGCAIQTSLSQRQCRLGRAAARTGCRSVELSRSRAIGQFRPLRGARSPLPSSLRHLTTMKSAIGDSDLLIVGPGVLGALAGQLW